MCEWQHASHNWEYKDLEINLFSWKVPKATQYLEGSDCSLCTKLGGTSWFVAEQHKVLFSHFPRPCGPQCLSAALLLALILVLFFIDDS